MNEKSLKWVNIFMNLLEKTIEKVIAECEYSGVLGDGSTGDGCGGAFSGDTYAKGDARVPKILGPVITRQGVAQSRNPAKPPKKKKKLTL